MYRPSIGATFEARDPLLLAGLQRAAALAGIEEAASSQSELALRSTGDGACHPSLDVACDERAVVITVTGQPSEESWLALHDLIGHLTSARVTSDRGIWGASPAASGGISARLWPERMWTIGQGDDVRKTSALAAGNPRVFIPVS